jgi:hypothetical protein
VYRPGREPVCLGKITCSASGFSGKQLLVAQIKAGRRFATEAERVVAFKSRTDGCKATYDNIKKGLPPPVEAPRIIVTNHLPADDGEAIRGDSEVAPAGARASKMVRLLDSQTDRALKSTAVARCVSLSASTQYQRGGAKWKAGTEAVEKYKELMAGEQGFRRLKDVLATRPIYHQVEHRVRAHIFVAALALLVQRFLEQRLQSVSADLSPERAMEALSTVRAVTFGLAGQPIRRRVTGGCPDARQVLKALKVLDLRTPAPAEGEETTM